MRRILLTVVIPPLLSWASCGGTACAISPQNPYRSFNLSGVNYGSMEWERAQREGRRVWPYYNTPASRVAPRATVDGVRRSASPPPRRMFRGGRR